MKRKSSKFIAVMLAAVLAVAPVQGAAAQEITPVTIETEQTESQPEVVEATTEAEKEPVTEENGDVVTPGSETSTEETSSEETSSEETSTEEASTEETTLPDNGDVQNPDEGGKDDTVSDNEADEDVVGDGTVSENTVSGNTVSSNTVSANEAEKDSLFPGMPEGYTLSAKELAEKSDLAANLSDFTKSVSGVDYTEGEVILWADNQEQAEVIAKAYGGNLLSYREKIAVIGLGQDVKVSQAMEAAADSTVAIPVVWPNYYRSTMQVKGSEKPITITESGLNDAAAIFGDQLLDPKYVAYQWQHNAVGSMYAWNGGYTGSGVKVAVLDTGGAAHEDVVFAGSYNAIDGTNVQTDIDGHGTHVAGIIGATRNNGVGGAGIAPDASLYAVKVLDDDGIGSDANIIRGINHAAAEDGFNVDIINMSLGGWQVNSLYEKAITDAVNGGTAVFAAAGNTYSQVKSYPAAYDDAICVAATNQGNTKASFSSYGSWVDLSGPGVDIPSTVPGGYTFMSGTSQATPVIAGTAAVILSANLPAIAKESGARKVEALKKVLTSNVKKASGTAIGKGIVDLPKALKVSTSIMAPGKPAFDQPGKVYKDISSLEVGIKAAEGTAIYYSVNGKTPSYKNGIITNGTLYTGKITLEGAKKVTLKAIAVNSWGKASPVTSASYTFNPGMSSIEITGSSKVLVNKSITLKANIYPNYATDKALDWTISPTGQNVTVKNGKVTAAKTAAPGEYTVTATAKNNKEVFDTHIVTVAAAATVKKVSFIKDEKKLSSLPLVRGSENEIYDLGSVLVVELASDPKIGTVSDVVFSTSNPKVAVVSNTGQLSATGGGTASITATAADGSGLSAKLTVKVTQNITGIDIIGNDVVGAGASVSFKASTSPITAKKSVIWTLAQPVDGVKISTSGKVTVAAGTKAGTFTVVATAKDAGKYSAQKVVTIKEGAVGKIVLSKTSVTLLRTSVFDDIAHMEASITATVTGDTGFDAEAYTVTSSNPGIAVVSKAGNVITIRATGAATGTSVVTVQSIDGKNKKATCKVTVNNPVSSVFVSQEAGRTEVIGKGSSLKLNATIETIYGPVTNKKVIWKSSDEKIATVDKNGKVKALNLGSASITAVAEDGSGTNGTYNIRVKDPIQKLAVDIFDYDPSVYSGVKISMKEVGVYLDGYYQYNGKSYIMDPSGSVFIDPSPTPTDYQVAIEIGNLDIIACSAGVAVPVFDNEGKVKFCVYGAYFKLLKPGKTTITLKAMDGSGKKTVHNITVTE